ncbi:MAG TPA: hypothetical protein VKS25_02775 [Solirubrobacteraceae bacterium]|nr:hypothetical protein [Solirubrobacteraceae bacterium]
MRSHGLSSYPDPKVSVSGNAVQIKISPGNTDPNSPSFRSASRSCGHLLPNGGRPPKTNPHELSKDLTYATCIRSHGVRNFPDPDHDGAFTLPAGLDQQASQFQRAVHACKGSEPSSISILNQNPRSS